MAKNNQNANNIICLALVCAISMSFFVIVSGVKELTFLLISAFVGVDFCQSAKTFLRERALAFCLYAFSLYGYFCDLSWKETPLHFISIVFLGIGIGGLLYVLLSSFFYGFCTPQKTISKKYYLLGSIVFPSFCIFLSFYVRYSSIVSVVLLSMLGLIGCYILSNSNMTRTSEFFEEHKVHKRNRLKISIFFLIISVSSSLIWAINAQNQPFQDPAQYTTILLTGISVGPIVTLFLVNKKGVYSGCIWLIFLAEISLMCTTLYRHMAYGPMIGTFTQGFLLTSTLTLCPILTYYMLGPHSFFDNFAKVIKSLIIGYLPILPLSTAPLVFINSTEITLATIFLLLGGFFTVFSAWSHRLVLLK